MNAPPAWTQLPDIDDAKIGSILKTARISLGLDLAEAGARCGFSASTVSRWENGKRHWSISDLATVAAALNVPAPLVGLSGHVHTTSHVQVARTLAMGNDERMKRRTLITGTLAAAGAAFGMSSPARADGIEHALFGPSDTEPVALRLLAAQVSAVENDLLATRLAELDRRLPGLLRGARATLESVTSGDKEQAGSLLARAMAVCSQHQIRVSREPIAALAAERTVRYAEEAGDPVTLADGVRLQAVVLRRSRSPIADDVMVEAAGRLASETGLTDANAAGMYAKILCSAAYTAAGNDDRATAVEYLGEATSVMDGRGDTPHLTPGDLAVFGVSVDRALGDFGATLYRAASVDLKSVAHVHERARYWQDVAMAAAGRGRPDQAIEALAELDQDAPQHLRDRPWLRELLDGLLHTRAGGSSALVHRLVNRLQMA
jgi:transcriptional regulator with XRE-family HTH domain